MRRTQGLPPTTYDDGASPPQTPSRPKRDDEEKSEDEQKNEMDTEDEKKETKAEEENVPTSKPVAVLIHPSIEQPTEDNDITAHTTCSSILNNVTLEPTSTSTKNSNSTSLPSRISNNDCEESKTTPQQKQQPQLQPQHLQSPRLVKFRGKHSLAELDTSEEHIPLAAAREIIPGAVAVANAVGLDDITLRDSFRPTASDPRIEAHLAPDEAEVEARIVERMEDEITRQVEERLISDIIVATEVKGDVCGLKRRTVGFLLLFLVLTIGGVVGGSVYSLTGNEERARPTQNSPTSAPIKPVDDPLVDELRAWIVPTEQDLVYFSDPTSAQSQALEWLRSDPITMSTNRTAEMVLQRYILAVLYFATSGPSWRWPYLSAEDVCTWNLGGNNTGVFCFGDGETVDGIQMFGTNLRGTLPWELVLLTNLEFVIMDDNRLSGTIPSRINELTRLRVFWVDSNDLTGPLPPSFASSISNIGLSGNAFTGTIPGNWATEMPNLQYLTLFTNALTGTIPSGLGLLPLSYFTFSGNTLTGSVDQSFCHRSEWPILTADCDEVDCPCCATCCYDDDQFNCVDRIFEELKAWIAPSEQDLDPFDDPLSAQSQALDWLRSDPFIMTADRTSETVLQRYVLAVLFFATSGYSWLWKSFLTDDVCTWNLGVNRTGVFCMGDGETVDGLRMSGNNLQGTLPWELALLSNLEFVDFNSNQLFGTIPSRMNELTRLGTFWAENNYLTGPVPSSFASSLVDLDLSENYLTSTIPGSWAIQMPNLQQLRLYNNMLTGTIPSELGNLPLNSLIFYMNAFTGSVDTIFCRGSTWPILVADCQEVECPCCTTCCDDNSFNCTNM